MLRNGLTLGEHGTRDGDRHDVVLRLWKPLFQLHPGVRVRLVHEDGVEVGVGRLPADEEKGVFVLDACRIRDGNGKITR